MLGLSLPLLIALEVAGGTLGLATTGARARRPARPRSPPSRLRALRPAPLAPRRGQAPGRRGPHGGDRPPRARAARRPRPPRPALRRLRARPRSRPVRRARSGRSPSAAHRGWPSRSTARSAPPTPTPASAASPANPRSPSQLPTAVPGHVMRFRKQRGFVYPLLPAADELGSPPLEAIAHAQASLGVPSTIRFTLTPAPGQPGSDRAPDLPPPREPARPPRAAGACPRPACSSTLNAPS